MRSPCKIKSMKKLALSTLLLFVLGLQNAFAAPITVDVISAPDGLTVQSGQGNYTFPTAKKTEEISTKTNTITLSNKSFDKTSAVYKQARGVYDFAVSGGATNANISLGMNIPAKAIIVKGVIDVVTPPTAQSGSPTIGISAATGQDIYGDIVVQNLFAGQFLTKQQGATANYVKLSGATNVTLNIKSAALTAGKIVVFLDYLISE